MATIKAYSDLQQSKVLAEILPLESADMSWVSIGLGKPFARTRPIKGDPEEFCACWSLTALLDVLPYCPDLSKHTDGKWYVTTYPNNVHTCLMAYDNPVDACVAMIELLHELKML